ncbi:GAF domain-containing protein [Chamaesiphon polymorphus]|uniref:Circadian input-output histidine kinase CikA n=1 Tax=Chamaesiphon polymorphus CCALA 037 TaxID=2107692 RepID=A0A2T1GIN0_9CYAN|nr:GAF domain-containing protein [Chamaesiphon polymorphus]PSB57492.1 diguanylate cyclase [Chamaesiphon polymorphus CCALA 037]
MLDPTPFAQSEAFSVLTSWHILCQPLVVSPQTMALDAIALMSDSPGAQLCQSTDELDSGDRGCIIIVENERPIGIFTATDVVRSIAQGQDLKNLTIHAVMRSPVVTLQQAQSADLSVAIDLIDRHRIRYLPLVDDRDCLVGIVTRDRLYRHLAAVDATAPRSRQSLAPEQMPSCLESSNPLGDRDTLLALRESQQFLQTVIESFPLDVFWKDRDSRYLGCNQNFARAANLTPAEIIGKTDYDLPWGEVEAGAYRADDRQTIESGIATLGIIETQRQVDGSSIWLETNKVPLRNLQGETIGVLGTYQNITARKHAETELKQLSERLSLSLKSGAVGCWEWDIIRDRFIWDERMYELHGQTRTNSESEQSDAYATWLKIVHPDDRRAIQKALAQAVLQTAEFNAEFRVIHPDGSIHHLKAYGLVERDERDRACRMVGINFDISAAKHAEQLRQQTEQTTRQQAEREFLLREMMQRIRKSLELPIVFDTAVREIRTFLETDRVGIFKFDPQWHSDVGEFVAESVADDFVTIMGAKIHDPNFDEQLAHYYQQGRIAAVEDIYTAGLLDTQVQMLANFQVRANLVLPLFDGKTLWGLLCVHHCREPRAWQETEIDFLKHVGEQIGIAIQQATLYETVQSELQIRWQAEEAIAHQLRQQQALGAIAQQIRNSLKVEEILATATNKVQELMLVDRVTIFRVFPDRQLRAVEEVVIPTYPSLRGRNWADEHIDKEEYDFYLAGNPNVVDDIGQDVRSVSLQEYVDAIGVKSKIVAPILLPVGDADTQSGLEPNDRVRLWGLLSIHACGCQRHWQAAEAQLLQQIADQLAIAIQQASLFEQLQTELTDRQQAETQLRQTNHQLAISNQELARATRLKDEFLASMSHELRTPLNAILGMSEALQIPAFGSLSPQQQHSISTIERSGKHLLSLINDILDLSKIEANKFVLNLSDVSIQSLCQNSVVFIKELAHKRQIRLTTQLPEYLKQLNIRVDDLRTRQILINLLSNAVKFTPEGGSVMLDVRVLDEETGKGRDGSTTDDLSDLRTSERLGNVTASRQIAFSIVDTGIGIAPENIPKLFQSFVQIDSSLNRQYAGTGLGLALVKRMVELHGGTVTVESQVDRGSCFRVCLPVELSAEIAVPPSVSPSAGDLAPGSQAISTGLKASILVVEDNEANMETMTGYLQSRGYELLGAGTGQQAIEMAQIHTPDVILMDIQMPDIDGFEAIGRLRQIPACAAIPIVALTALAMPADRQKCLDAGADRYVSKPVRLGQLVSTIETLLQNN